MKDTTEWATIGKIVAPFGIRVSLKYFSLSDIPDRFVTLKAVYLSPDYSRTRIKGVRPYKGTMCVCEVTLVSMMRRPPKVCAIMICAFHRMSWQTLPPDSYYQHDILDLQVLDWMDAKLGVSLISWVTGGNDVYVIKATEWTTISYSSHQRCH